MSPAVVAAQVTARSPRSRDRPVEHTALTAYSPSRHTTMQRPPGSQRWRTTRRFTGPDTGPRGDAATSAWARVSVAPAAEPIADPRRDPGASGADAPVSDPPVPEAIGYARRGLQFVTCALRTSRPAFSSIEQSPGR